MTTLPASYLPLSVGQEGMWFIHRLAPQSAAYNVALAVRIRSPLDLPRLGRAVTAVADRHDVLRSTFVEVDGRPWRVVAPAGGDGSVGLAVREVPGAGLGRLRALAGAASAAPFPLAGGRAFRVVLLRRRPDDAVLIVAAHHIVADAPSLFLLLRDLLTAYRAIDGDQSAGPPPPLRHGYDEYVAMERRLLGSPRGERLARHWREICAGSTPARLVPDHSAPARPGHAGASCQLRTPADFPARLRSASTAAGVTPFAYLLGAFQSMLYRQTGQADFLIGTPVAVRLVPGLRDVVGYLVNTLPLRARFDRATTFADAVASAQRQVALGLANVGYPFPMMADATGPALAADRPPLFRITFTMLFPDRMEPSLPATDGAADGGDTEYAGLRISYVEIPQQEGQFDLSVELRHSSTSLSGVFRYRTDLFEPATIQSLVERFGRTMDVAMAEPASRVADFSLVDRAELDQLLALGRE
jgi:hypothetical protein